MQKSTKELYSERIAIQKAHTCKITTADYERIAPKIEMIKQLAEIESAIYTVFDLHKGNYLLQSEEQERIFGISSPGETNINSEMHYKRIHPDDVAFVLETDNLLHHFFSGLPFSEKRNYKLVYDFRTKTADGFYARHMHQCVALEQDTTGKTWLTLVITHPLSDRNENVKPYRHLINLKTGKLCLFNELDDSSNSIMLTKREKEVLSLIGRGYDSVNIADKLHISVNTVNNHRQNILRKTKTDNATQAVLYCKRLGVI